MIGQGHIQGSLYVNRLTEVFFQILHTYRVLSLVVLKYGHVTWLECTWFKMQRPQGFRFPILPGLGYLCIHMRWLRDRSNSNTEIILRFIPYACSLKVILFNVVTSCVKQRSELKAFQTLKYSIFQPSGLRDAQPCSQWGQRLTPSSVYRAVGCSSALPTDLQAISTVQSHRRQGTRSECEPYSSTQRKQRHNVCEEGHPSVFLSRETWFHYSQGIASYKPCQLSQ